MKEPRSDAPVVGDKEEVPFGREVPALAEVKVKARKKDEPGKPKEIRVRRPGADGPASGSSGSGGAGGAKGGAKGGGGGDGGKAEPGAKETLSCTLIGAGDRPLKNYPFKLLESDPEEDDEITPQKLDGGTTKNRFTSGWWFTDADGKVEFKDMPKGEYVLRLWSREGKIELTEDEFDASEPGEETGDGDLAGEGA